MTNFIEATKIELKKRTPEELVNKITELVTDKIIKNKEIEDLQKDLAKKMEIINNLRARIDKAIEYIKKNIPYWEEWHYDCCLDTEDMNEIISLLKGEE